MAEALTNEAEFSDDIAPVRGAYEELLPEIQAVPEEQVLQINIDIPPAVTSILGALPEIMVLRPRLVGLPEFDIRHLDNLGKYAMAMDHANTVHLMQTKSPASVAELAKRCERVREVLLADLNTAAVRGLIDGSSLKGLRGINSYRNTVFDTFAVAHLARSNWTRLEGKTALTLPEVLEAEQLADQLNVALGQREQGPAVTGPTAEIRGQAYTLFIRAYNAVRRAVQYLEGDRVDEIVPSIRVGRGPAKKRDDDSESEPNVPAAAVDSGMHTTPAGKESAEVPVGMPGASPFVRG